MFSGMDYQVMPLLQRLSALPDVGLGDNALRKA